MEDSRLKKKKNIIRYAIYVVLVYTEIQSFMKLNLDFF